MRLLRRRRPRGGRDPLERYLRRLSFWLPRCARAEMVAEARRHLYDATRRAQEAGLDHAAARAHALRAFGPAWRIGLATRRAYGSRLLACADALARSLARPRHLVRHRRPRRRTRSSRA